MATLKNLIIHCSDTPYNRNVTPDDIFLWHLGSRQLKSGLYKFLGSVYNISQLKKKVLVLPSGKKIPAHLTNGRGWTKVGYADMIDRKANLINLTPYDADDIIEPWEITNGAVGYNLNSRHVVLAGGWTKDGNRSPGILSSDDINKLYTPDMVQKLTDYVNFNKEIYENINVIGHNNVASKSCPNFNVKELF